MPEEYSRIKIVLWRYGRVFLAAFIGSLSVDQLLVGTPDVRDSILRASVAAGIAAIAKALREGKDYDQAVHRLPL